MVLEGRVGQPEAVSGGLLRSGSQDCGNDADLAIGGAFGRAARGPASHALRSQSNGSGGSARRIVIGRSLVAGLSLSPRPEHWFYGSALTRDPDGPSAPGDVAPTYLSVPVGAGMRPVWVP